MNEIYIFFEGEYVLQKKCEILKKKETVEKNSRWTRENFYLHRDIYLIRRHHPMYYEQTIPTLPLEIILRRVKLLTIAAKWFYLRDIRRRIFP